MIELWIDGSYFILNQEKIASAGLIIKKGEITIAKSSKITGKGKEMNNNIAEYNAFIYALREIKRRQLDTEEILIRSNSRLLVDQMNGSWKAKTETIFPLYREARQIAINLKLKIKWISKEVNIEANEMARLALKNWIENNCDPKYLKKDEKVTFSCISKDDINKEENYQLKETRNSFKKYTEIERIGETENIFIDYDATLELFLLYGKEISGDCPFKIGLKRNELERIIELFSNFKKTF